MSCHFLNISFSFLFCKIRTFQIQYVETQELSPTRILSGFFKRKLWKLIKIKRLSSDPSIIFPFKFRSRREEALAGVAQWIDRRPVN